MSAIPPVLNVPYAGENLTYASLPVSGDDGFPQAFLLDMNGTVYRLTFGIMFSDPSLVLSPEYASQFFDLPDAELGLYLNLKVEVESLPAPDRLVGVSRIVPDIPIILGPLAFQFSRIKVAQPNLSGPGLYGSEIVGGVAFNG